MTTFDTSDGTTFDSLDAAIDHELTSDALLAAEARHGGRAITKNVAWAVERHSGGPGDFARFAASKGWAHVWHETIDPSSYAESGVTREQACQRSWQHIARRAAGLGDFAPERQSERPDIHAVILQDAEAMVTWPIYAAATGWSRQDLLDIADALYAAHDDLSGRVDGPDYEDEDRPAIRSKLSRWEALFNRIIATVA